MGIAVVSADAQSTVKGQTARDTPGRVTKREYKRIKTAGFEGESFGHRKDTRIPFSRNGTNIRRPRMTSTASGFAASMDAQRPRSQAEIAARGRRERLVRANVAVDENGDVALAGLRGDTVERNSGQRGGGGVAGTQRVGGDPRTVQSGGFGAGAQHPSRHHVWRQWLETDLAGPAPREQRARRLAADGAPRSRCGDRVGAAVPAVGDGNELTVTYLVGLRPAHVLQQTGGPVLDVGHLQCDGLGASHGRGNLANVRDGECACQPARRTAVEAA